MTENKKSFLKGFKDAFPIFVSYFAVSIGLGISCRNASMNLFSSALMSFTNLTSAGQFAGIRIISENGTYFENVLAQIAINIRYLLMSAVLASKLSESYGFKSRLLMSVGITDEIFGLSAAQSDLKPIYTFGCYCMAMPGWVIGTILGVVLGNSFNSDVVNALNIALYGMFIAIIIPPARKNHVLFYFIALAMVLSYLCDKLFVNLTFGIKVVILTVLLSALASLVCPLKENQ